MESDPSGYHPGASTACHSHPRLTSLSKVLLSHRSEGAQRLSSPGLVGKISHSHTYQVSPNVLWLRCKMPYTSFYMIEHWILAGGSALGEHGTFRRWSLPEEVDCRDGPKDSCPIPLPDLTWNKQIHTPAALKPHAFYCASPPWTASLPAVNQINPSDLRMFLLGVLSQPCDEQLMHTVWQLLCA